MEELTAKEMKMLKDMDDSRVVDELLLYAFKEGGFKEIYETAKKDPSLEICLRGNSGAIIIYYMNHKIWELSLKDGECVVSISFNHARYSIDYPKKLETLQGYGFGKNKTLELRPYYKTNESGERYLAAVGYPSDGIIKSTDAVTSGFVEGTLKVLKAIVDDFFDPDKTTDYFKEDWNNKDNPEKIEIKERSKSPCIEKRWQQSIFRKMKNAQDGYYAYDMEFSQKYPNGDIRKKMETNEPDILAIRYENNEPKALVLVEVKSTRSACVGDCNIKKHLKGMKNYSDNTILVGKRVTEAKQMLEQFKELELLDDKVDIEILENKIERLLILTNNTIPGKEYTDEMKKDPKYQSAIDYYRNKRVTKGINACAKESDCQIRIIEDCYWEDYTI